MTMAIRRSSCCTGRDSPAGDLIHRNLCGREALDEQTVVNDHHLFDEAAYLRLYPDIARAISEGREVSAWDHFDRHGRTEGRKLNDFEADYYLRSYPAAAQEIAAGLAASPFEHYRIYGRPRGFLSDPKADRAANAVATRPPVG